MKIRKGFLALLAVPMLLVSCLKSEETQLDPYAAITSFSVGNFKVWYHDINIKGNDTLVYRTESGTMYPMTIDQLNNKIYNVDSVSYGAKVDRLLLSIEASGYVYYSKKRVDGTYVDTIWSSSDSIDLSEPVKFKVVSPDAEYIREYDVCLNVHKIHPDSMTWSASDTIGYTLLKEQASVIREDSIYLFGKDSSGAMALVTRSIKKNTRWAAPVLLTGVDAESWDKSVIEYNGGFYLLQNGQLYTSTNGVDWEKSQANMNFRCLVSSSNSEYSEGLCWALSESGDIVCSADMVDWEVYQQNVASFPTRKVSMCCYPLKSNPQILRSVLVGLDDNEFMSASVWTRLSTDNEWTKITPSSTNDKRLPKLEGLSLIRYDDDLYAFGSGMMKFYQSKDNGVTWRDCSLATNDYSSWNRYMKFPDEFIGKLTTISSVTDSNNVIWVMTDKGQVWRGGINRLMK